MEYIPVTIPQDVAQKLGVHPDAVYGMANNGDMCIGSSGKPTEYLYEKSDGPWLIVKRKLSLAQHLKNLNWRCGLLYATEARFVLVPPNIVLLGRDGRYYNYRWPEGLPHDKEFDGSFVSLDSNGYPIVPNG